ncbi:hypothetical protein [Paraglaciecola sp. MB-3u-78]|uniref:hypothetical protein n=1 Tax=Paraglaciecola sp. MB-3u-78 TaxID=2058332 RepID=UPI000C3204E0|nr:hypothetical protein [Paraglaciecola sp. MB-3u-78]PKG97190.1 hypothetical protein CXF95_21610 [Paraglaciecola sp. MB-3u-78]
MGFKDVKRQLVDCLKSGNIVHEQRDNINLKNLLATGQISVDLVTDIVSQTRGNEHRESPHYFDSTVDVHVIKTSFQGKNWYIKWYLIEPNSVFISVHH